jgi:hypothetical protein
MESIDEFFFATNTIAIIYFIRLLISLYKEVIRMKKFGTDRRDYNKTINRFYKFGILFVALILWNLYSNVGYLNNMIYKLETIFYQNIIYIID